VYIEFYCRITISLLLDTVFVALCTSCVLFCVQSLDNVLLGFIRAVMSDAYTCLEGHEQGTDA